MFLVCLMTSIRDLKKINDSQKAKNSVYVISIHAVICSKINIFSLLLEYVIMQLIYIAKILLIESHWRIKIDLESRTMAGLGSARTLRL